MNKKGCFKIILISIGVMFIIGAITLERDLARERKAENEKLDNRSKIEVLIEEEKFTEAKALVRNDRVYTKKILKAQIANIADRGDFELARQVAQEENYYSIYFRYVMNNLVPIYEKHGERKLLYALSLVKYPEPNSVKVKEKWWDNVDNEYSSDVDRTSQIINENNSCLESFANYLLSTNNKKLISTILTAYLKPTWIPADDKWDVGTQKWIHIKDAYYDYSEVKRIKNRFGVK